MEEQIVKRIRAHGGKSTFCTYINEENCQKSPLLLEGAEGYTENQI
jgi:hypothetical protein